jgi:hypothetical protein
MALDLLLKSVDLLLQRTPLPWTGCVLKALLRPSKPIPSVCQVADMTIEFVRALRSARSGVRIVRGLLIEQDVPKDDPTNCSNSADDCARARKDRADLCPQHDPTFRGEAPRTQPDRVTEVGRTDFRRRIP